MHRLGFTEDQLPQLIQVLKSHPEVNIVSVFSHLAGSDDPALDDFTRQQIDFFIRIAGQLDRALGYKPLRHLLNSSGIVRFPEASFDMVRLGIGLYGIANEPETLDKLQNVSVLKTVISQIKTIAAGETIGYSRKWFVAEPTTIAIIPVGYANGKGYVKVNGHRVPIIGNISMDMCSIDITNVQAKEGDAVIVFDSPEDIKIFADSLETIPYEVITGISQRVKRVYLIE
jgi:alanine racemase